MRLDFVPGVRRVAALTSEHCGGAGCRVQGTECRGAGWRGRGGRPGPWWCSHGWPLGSAQDALGPGNTVVASQSGARPGGPAAEPALRPLRLSFPGTGSAMSL